MRNLYLSFILVLIGGVAISQNTSNSPYSSFGLGEHGGMDHAVFSALGNSTITMIDSTVLNFYNPSSYSSLSKGQPIFSFGISSRLSNYSENGVSSFGNITSIQHFAIAFPFAKRFGLAFGLKPYSRRGYEFSSRNAVGEDSLYYNYSGSGGINEAFLGASVMALNFKGAKISIGGNAGYLFGNVTNTKKSGLIVSGTDSYSGGISTKKIDTRSFHYELGLHYSQRIKKQHEIGLSAIVEPFQKINGSYEDGLFYSSDIDNHNIFDTLSLNDTLSGNISNVPTYTVGFNYNFRFKGRKGQNNELNSVISAYGSYKESDWSIFENTFEPEFSNTFLKTSKMTFGIQYVPETDFITNKVVTKFYHRIKYRIGVYQFTLPYQRNGEQVSDFGTTFGFGLPIVVQNSLSSINFGFTIGNRGVSDPQVLKEQYYGINLGISIAPGTDRWFVKRKLN